MLPMDAAVIPLPREDSIPTVTKTQFDNPDLLRFFRVYRRTRRVSGRPGPLDARVEDHHLRLALGRAAGLHLEPRLRLGLGHAHLLEEALDGRQLRPDRGVA